MRPMKSTMLALAVAALVTACGGGGTAETTPRAKITSVKVFGDSIQDSGTFLDPVLLSHLGLNHPVK